MKYGQLPVSLGIYPVDVQEMFFYQYLPIKLAGETNITNESRLSVFDKLIGVACCDFIGVFGLDRYVNSYVYITAKHLYQSKGCEFNRHGWHSDGFLTNDINYIWSNTNPTTFNNSDFVLTPDHGLSLSEMEKQADFRNDFNCEDNELLRLDQYVIHKVSDTKVTGMRAFLKISFSTEKYNLIGNSYNYNLNYNWDMMPRQNERNHPIS